MAQEVNTTSWGSRIVSSLLGVIVGLGLIIGSFVLIFWNESNSLHTSQSLEQAEKALIPTTSSPIHMNNDHHVIYFYGQAETHNILEDNVLGLSEKAIKLDRKVEMYQWKEDVSTQTEKETGGSVKETKTYNYEKVWSDSLIDSGDFKEQADHKNPEHMPLKSQQIVAEKVSVGDFHLPADLIAQISESKPVDLSKLDIAPLQTRLKKPVSHDGDSLYVGDDPSNPKIGDIKISVTEVLPQTVSIIAQQNGNTLEPYMAPAGKSVSLLVSGQKSPQQMIAQAQSENTIMMWILRLVSLVLMMVGIGLILKPLSVIADVLPFLGNIVSAGTGLIAFVCGLLLWGFGTALAWFTVRPLMALGLIAIVVGISYLVLRRRKNNAAKPN